MSDRTWSAVWLAVFLALIVFAVPWFHWGRGGVVAGLPTWVWYHVAWLALTAGVFYIFTQRGWGRIVGVRR